jgi:flagellar hook-associated protein 3 FlgL
MIRVTRNTFLERANAALARTSVALSRAEEQSVTGLRLNRPSDMPRIVQEAERMNAAAADQDVWEENAGFAEGLHSTLETALASAGTILIRLRELAIEGSSETLDLQGRVAIAHEVSALRDALRAVANTSHDGRHVFAGTAWDVEPFDATYTYVGNADVPETRIGDSRWVETGMDGSALFNGPVDIFATITTLETELLANNTAGIRGTLNDMELATETISDGRAQVGTFMNVADDAIAVAGSLRVVFNDRLADLIEADPIEAYTTLAQLRSSYEAALQVAGSGSSRTLFDYLS